MTTNDEGIYGLEPEEPRAKSPAYRPPTADPHAQAIPCRKCGYDIRGLSAPRCPECGTSLREGVSSGKVIEEKPSLKDKPALYAGVLAAIGFVANVMLGCLFADNGESFVTNAIAISVQTVILLGISCAVFLLCAMTWIGWSSFFLATMLQVCAAYSLTFAASNLFHLIPIFIIPWLLSIIMLVGLLVELVDLELQDAVIVALLVILTRVLISAALLAYLIQ